MKNKPVIIVAGEPYSVFLEIFFKAFKKGKLRNFNNPILLICSCALLKKQMKKLNYNFIVNEITFDEVSDLSNNNRNINVLNVDFKFHKVFDKISTNSNTYLDNCFSLALKLIKKYNLKYLINGPISKEHFLNKKYLGMTEYFAAKTQSKNKEVMLIYSKNLSVSPVTTHLPFREVTKNLTIKKIIYNAKIIKDFYKKFLKINPNIAFTGLNPHCETTNKISEEKEIISPAIKKLKRGKIKVGGPYPADTLFLKKNYPNYNVIIGMYHDQVLTPIKTLYGFKAINVTLGLPFIRITPDHGPNNHMLGKKKSNPDSFIEAIRFIEKLSAN
tara:strand:+ start:451 stop:1437 length:987 start_codon:yes stop_codon:yes gene_type:complete